MKLIEHAKGVYEIEEFLTTEIQNMLLSMINDDGWDNDHPGNIIKEINVEDRLKIKNLLSDKINSIFINSKEFTPITNLRKLSKGEDMPVHADGGLPGDKRGTIMFGIAIYINDNFSGGELFYPEIDLIVKPKARSLVVHDAKLKHGVKEVISGNRYSVTVFVFGDETTTIKVL